MTDRIERREVRWRLWQQLPLLIVLVVLWMLLWGTVSLLSIASGAIVAVVVTRLFYLPPVELSGRFNPFFGAIFLARFAFNVVVGSFSVAWLALRPRHVPTSSVIAVDLVTRSDFILTLTALAISLIPGSLVVEVDRGRSILYLHAIGIDSDAGVEKLRAKVLSVERGIVRALGSRDDVERTAV
ncbi:Na+/H+ antiporter subunit E [soil metagenome]